MPTQHLYMPIQLSSRFSLSEHFRGGFPTNPPEVFRLRWPEPTRQPRADAYTSTPYGLFPHLGLTVSHYSTLLLSLPTRYSYTISSIYVPCNYELTTFLLSLTFPNYAAQVIYTVAILLPKFTAAPRCTEGVEDTQSIYPQNLSKALTNFMASTLGDKFVPRRNIMATLLG